MADYSYDESGNMAAYFLLTFLLVVLIPFTLSSTTSFRQTQRKDGCPCQECVAHRAKLQPRLFNPKTKRRSLILLAGWSLFGFLVYRVATSKIENKVYNPFEILGISTGLTVKEIKSHYKQLSKKFHPDKVKLAVNETMEAVEARFVEITKAYKSLTDDTIRQNWERYGHPDGRQEISMGIALPKTIIEGRNRNLTLAAYGLIFGGMLPAIVGRWWFGNREKTKDGVNARSAATFFKSLSEESGIDDVVASLGKSFEYERRQVTTNETELAQLEKQIEEKLGSKWDSLKRLAEAQPKFVARRRAFILLHAHLLRLPIQSSSLRKEQTEVLLQTPTLLNSLLNIVMTRNWLVPAIAAMRLHAYLTQALLPGDDTLRFAQLPGIAEAEAKELSSEVSDVSQVPEALADKEDGRTGEIKKALSRWGKLDIVDASFKVIGECVVTPLSIVFLVVKLRITPPTGQTQVKDNKEEAPANGQRDKAEEEFLNSRKEVDDMPEGTTDPGWAHAPHWPANRKPGWWLVLADPKIGRIIVPPMKISDVPLANPNSSRDYRSYKVQFQAPPNVMAFAWKVYLVSDTYVGEEVSRDVRLSIEEARDEEVVEDDISDPEEDSLAGQMAMMRGGSVKKRGDDESDEESSTDDDEKSDDDSSSSDSD